MSSPNPGPEPVASRRATTRLRGALGLPVAFLGGLALHVDGVTLVIAITVLGVTTLVASVTELLSSPWGAQLLGYRQLRWNVTHSATSGELRHLGEQTGELARDAIAAAQRCGPPRGPG